MTKHQQPKFIVLEGGEGAGKSSLIKAIKEKLGDSVLLTREPGGSSYAEAIRETALKHPLSKDAVAETMICLMFAARFDHVEKLIKPTLAKGQNVISDRFDASSYAYQIHAQKGKHLEKLFWNLRSHISRKPDLYIYLDVDVEEGLRRARSRNSKNTEGNHFDDREVDFHKLLRKGYKIFLKKVPHVVIDANRPFEEVRVEFLKTVEKLLT